MPASFIDEINAWEQGEALKILMECGLDKGMSVLDFGCGMPHYAMPAAKIVGDSGIVYAVDKNQWILDHIGQRMDNEGITNIERIKSNENKIKNFNNPVKFIMYYDMFQSIGKGMNGRITENKKLFREFYRILDTGGILSFAVYSEVAAVMDYANGPFTPKGEPKYIWIPYEEAFTEWYKFIPLIESCGFRLKNTAKNGGVHFDEIDLKLHLKKYESIQFSDLERRDIYNFEKVSV